MADPHPLPNVPRRDATGGAAMIERRARCDGCGTTRPLAELLIIHDRHDASRAPWYCCRSSAPGAARGDCLRLAAGPTADYAIALADPGAEAGPSHWRRSGPMSSVPESAGEAPGGGVAPKPDVIPYYPRLLRRERNLGCP
jgi:hypothetical protein